MRDGRNCCLVWQSGRRVARIADGYRLEFEATDELLHAIASFIAAERHCCRFLRFQITVEPDDGPIRLDITGPAGTTQLLDDVLDRGSVSSRLLVCSR
jgi:hypothetical protein